MPVLDGDRVPGTLQDLDGLGLLRRDIVMGVQNLSATELHLRAWQMEDGSGG